MNQIHTSELSLLFFSVKAYLDAYKEFTILLQFPLNSFHVKNLR